MPRIKPKSSRRAAPLKDEDYDHEISLVDNAPESDAGFDDGLDDIQHVDSIERDGSPAPRPSVTLSVDGADGAADREGVTGASKQDGDLRTSSPSPSPATRPAAAGDTSLTPAVTATSTTPLLDNTLSTFPTAVGGPSRSRSSSRGRQPRRYGSISNGAPAPLNNAPTVQVQDATPIHEYPTAASTSTAVQGKQPEHASRHKKGLSVDVTQLPISEQPTRQSMQSSIRREPEAAIDVLYENERGLFLCGIPLFSRQALGNLDPSPWTNSAHRTSPTDIHTAQVPDPTWEWAWPEWRINHDEDSGAGEDGWQYSFMFAKTFKWHGPSWYRSFVRRRAWIRKRVKRKSAASVSLAAASLGLGKIDSIADPTLLNPDYFTVVSAAQMRRSSSRARARSRSHSRVGSRSSLAAPSVGQSCIYKTESGQTRQSGEMENGNDNGESSHQDDDTYIDDDNFFEMPKQIKDVDVLMHYLRAARIDREKVEAVDNFIQNAGEDLVRLQDFMHEIMALFVFQASRRALLTHLTNAHDAASAARQVEDKAKEADGGEDTAPKLQAIDRRMEYLTEAVKHADEEVRRLEYWSDIKAMAKQGSTQGAVDKAEGWDAKKWQGVDQSGPKPPPAKS